MNLHRLLLPSSPFLVALIRSFPIGRKGVTLDLETYKINTTFQNRILIFVEKLDSLSVSDNTQGTLNFMESPIRPFLLFMLTTTLSHARQKVTLLNGSLYSQTYSHPYFIKIVISFGTMLDQKHYYLCMHSIISHLKQGHSVVATNNNELSPFR